MYKPASGNRVLILLKNCGWPLGKSGLDFKLVLVLRGLFFSRVNHKHGYNPA